MTQNLPAMSDERVELVQRFWRAVQNLGPFTPEGIEAGRFDALVDDFHDPGAVFDLTHWEDWPDSPTYEGLEGLKRLFATWYPMFERVQWEVERIVAAGERVVAVAVQRGWPHGGSEPVAMRMTFVSDFRAGRIVRTSFYSDSAEAFAAVGIPSEAARE